MIVSSLFVFLLNPNYFLSLICHFIRYGVQEDLFSMTSSSREQNENDKNAANRLLIVKKLNEGIKRRFSMKTAKIYSDNIKHMIGFPLLKYRNC